MKGSCRRSSCIVACDPPGQPRDTQSRDPCPSHEAFVASTTATFSLGVHGCNAWVNGLRRAERRSVLGAMVRRPVFGLQHQGTGLARRGCHGLISPPPFPETCSKSEGTQPAGHEHGEPRLSPCIPVDQWLEPQDRQVSSSGAAMPVS